MVVVMVGAALLINMVVTAGPQLVGGTAPLPSGTPTAGNATPTPGTFGIFDPAQNVSSYAKYLVAALIGTIAAILEMFLVILYAAFFVNDPRFSQNPLGLPVGTVRVLLFGVVVLIILVLSALPD